METFVCPHCSKNIELTEAFTHQVEEKLRVDLETKHKRELDEALKTSELKLRQKIEGEQALKIKDQENETSELRDQNKQLKQQVLETNKLLRNLQDKLENQDIELQKQVAKEREAIKEKAEEEHRLKHLEDQKRIADMGKLIEDLKRKQEQGSMQTQGEVLELDMEDTLRRTFIHDTIEPVGKGVTGADVKQIVKTPRGTVCGVILWEFKRTKAWSDDWVVKLKNDTRSQKAHLAAIITQALPPEAKKGMGHKDGVWVANYELFLSLAELLRKNLIDIGRQKAIQNNSANKAEQLYQYITSHEFRQQVEAIIDVFTEMNDQVTKERVSFEKIWKQREGQARRLLISTAGMIGGMQGSGAALPQIKGLDLLEDGTEEDNPVVTEKPSHPDNQSSTQSLF